MYVYISCQVTFSYVLNQSLFSISYFLIHDKRPVHPVGPYAIQQYNAKNTNRDASHYYWLRFFKSLYIFYFFVISRSLVVERVSLRGAARSNVTNV